MGNNQSEAKVRAPSEAGDVSSELRASLTKGLHKRASTSQQPHRFKVKKFARKWDCGNPRYGADKAPSQMGLLCGQRTRPSGFAEATPSELATFYKTQQAAAGQTIEYLEGERRNASDAEDVFEGRDPYVRPQNAHFDDKESDTLTQQNLKRLDSRAGDARNDTIDEITFVDYPTLEKD